MKTTVLVIEDEPAIVDMLVEQLKNFGCHAFGLVNPDKDTLSALFSETKFDYLVTDLKMPKIHGSEAADLAIKYNAARHIIFFSAFFDRGMELTGHKIDKVDYLKNENVLTDLIARLYFEDSGGTR